MSLNLKMTRNASTARRTHERELIFDLVDTLRGHFSADDLVFGLHRRGQRVSRATVYRTLDLLVNRGMLQRVSMDEGGFLYEHIHGRKQHAHLYCVDCGQVFDYPMPVLGRLPQRVQREAGFEAEHLLLRVCGHCKRCRNRRVRAGRKARPE